MKRKGFSAIDTLIVLATTATLTTMLIASGKDSLAAAQSFNPNTFEKLATETLSKYSYKSLENDFGTASFKKYGLNVYVEQVTDCGVSVTVSDDKYKTTLNYCNKKNFTQHLSNFTEV